MPDPKPAQPLLSVVMPVYNERQTVLEIVRRVREVDIDKELIIVDDGSKDGTREILRREIEPLDGVRVVYAEKNGGKGSALRTAFRMVRGQITIVQDADLEYDPQDYHKMIDPILQGKADVVYGSRFVGYPRKAMLFWHTVGNRLLTTLSNLFTNLNLSDMETCYKALRSDLVRSLTIRSNRFGVEPEITAKVAKLRCNIYEVPISYAGRSYSEGKKIRWWDGLVAIWVILKYWLIDDVGDVGRFTLGVLERAAKYNRWLYNMIEPYLGERILEVGAGMGNISRLMSGHRLLVVTDEERNYLLYLEAAFGKFQNIFVHFFDLNQEPGVEIREFHFDTIVCMNVLEHIEDDLQALRRLRSLLVPGGRLVLLVPAMRRLYGSLDRFLGHHRRYEKPDLRGRLEQEGYRIHVLRYLNMIGALGWFVTARLLKRRTLSISGLRFFDLLVPLLKLEEKVIPPFGLSVLAVAEKKEEA